MTNMARSRRVSLKTVHEYILTKDEPGFVVSEIAEEFDVSQETARNMLEELVRQGKLERKNPTPRVVFYYDSSR